MASGNNRPRQPRKSLAEMAGIAGRKPSATATATAQADLDPGNPSFQSWPGNGRPTLAWLRGAIGELRHAICLATQRACRSRLRRVAAAANEGFMRLDDIQTVAVECGITRNSCPRRQLRL